MHCVGRFVLEKTDEVVMDIGGKSQREFGGVPLNYCVITLQ